VLMNNRVSIDRRKFKINGPFCDAFIYLRANQLRYYAGKGNVQGEKSFKQEDKMFCNFYNIHTLHILIINILTKLCT
jgi:hypothetical protein